MNIDFFRDSVIDFVLEVEVNPDNASTFEEWYIGATEESPVLGEGYQHQPNKWGKECRIYFNSDSDLIDEFANIDVDVETGARPYRSRWQYRVNNCEFFESLIHSGYRLGEN